MIINEIKDGKRILGLAPDEGEQVFMPAKGLFDTLLCDLKRFSNIRMDASPLARVSRTSFLLHGFIDYAGQSYEALFMGYASGNARLLSYVGKNTILSEKIAAAMKERKAAIWLRTFVKTLYYVSFLPMSVLSLFLLFSGHSGLALFGFLFVIGMRMLYHITRDNLN